MIEEESRFIGQTSFSTDYNTQTFNQKHSQNLINPMKPCFILLHILVYNNDNFQILTVNVFPLFLNYDYFQIIHIFSKNNQLTPVPLLGCLNSLSPQIEILTILFKMNIFNVSRYTHIRFYSLSHTCKSSGTRNSHIKTLNFDQKNQKFQSAHFSV
ncbi:unnamed protein product [Paramecium octaurelia]|uniref:Uncharacterized protein n=1 Tax=Paramecium octaurelia TaxID=43137 RepID=A0A8S1WCM6_PAROT|nr:unnamed protein product [Paramecium octaurelia]